MLRHLLHVRYRENRFLGRALLKRNMLVSTLNIMYYGLSSVKVSTVNLVLIMRKARACPGCLVSVQVVSLSSITALFLKQWP
jgi:hypothetical protein